MLDYAHGQTSKRAAVCTDGIQLISALRNGGKMTDEHLKLAMETSRKLGDNVPLITMSTDLYMIDRLEAIQKGRWRMLEEVYLRDENSKEYWIKQREKLEKENEASHKVI